MIKVTVIESDLKILRYLEALLAGAEGAEGIKLIGAYSSGEKTLADMSDEVPDVLITDLELHDISGLNVIRKVSETFGAIRILVHTIRDDRENILSAFRAGASGYLLKGASSLDIINAVKEVMRGGVPMSSGIARCVINEFKNCNGKTPDVLLTQREKEVLNGIANGFSKHTVASKLSISPHTVHAHMKKIYRKLKVRSKIEAIQKAKERGCF